MKIKDVPGEYGFRAIVKLPYFGFYQWYLTDGYYFSLEEAKTAQGTQEIKWPVEVNSDGVVYVPAEEELKEEKSK